MRRVIAQGSKKPTGARRGTRQLPLDGVAQEAVELLTTTLLRSGFVAEEIERTVQETLKRNRRIKSPRPAHASLAYADAAHVVTVWYADPQYLEPNGMPRPLKLSGPAPSLTSLVRQAGTMQVEEARRYLLEMRMLRKVGQRYLPCRRVGHLRGMRQATHFRDLRSIVVALRTLKHNLQPKRRARSLFHYIAENPRFPVSRVPALDSYIYREGMAVLKRLDAYMERGEARRKPNEKTVRVGVGMFRFEDPQQRRLKR